MIAKIKLMEPAQEALGLQGELMWIVVETVGVDSRYQRPLNDKHVAKIAREFDADLLGVVLVSERENGTRVAMDGQHRLEALRLLGHAKAAVPAIVYRHLSPQLEAKVFAEANRGRLSLLPPYVFRARLMAEEPAALAIRDLVGDFGFHLNYWQPLPDQDPGMNKAEGMITALGELQKLYGEAGGKRRLRDILGIAHDAWGADVLGLSGVILRGLSIFLGTWGELMERERLIAAIQKSTPARLETDAKDLPGRKPAAIAETLRRRYNSSTTRGSRLPERNLRSAR